MKIEVIYIPCYRRDFRLARICIASIRHWYPDIPIVLVKDLMMHDFNTSELEKTFNVSVYPQKAKLYGWGFSKFEPMFEETGKRFLFLDADTVMAGPLLDQLNKYNEDYIVNEEPYSLEEVYRYYFDLEKLKVFDPEFNFPEFTFNSGQYVGTAGCLRRNDLDHLINWTEPRTVKNREVFTFGGEQPVLNYILMKKMTKGELSLKRFPFMVSGLSEETANVSVDKVMNKEGYPYLLHWHDKKPDVFDPKMRQIPRKDILLHFEDIYFRRAGVSKQVQNYRLWKNKISDFVFMKALMLYKGQIGIKDLFTKI